MKKCFEFDSYKKFLAHVEEERAALQRGFRTRLAEALGVQNAYVSKVLNGDAHLSLEQGLRLCEFLALEGEEKQHLVFLIEFGRAGTNELKDFFRQLLGESREKHLNIKERVGSTRTLTSETQTTYYSHWFFGAIHAIVSIPGYQDIESIAKALQLERKVVEDAVLFLVQCGILDQEKGHIKTGTAQLHLDRTSPNITKHHTNWRIRAIDSLAGGDESDVHYSTISSLSVADVGEIRARLVKTVQDYVETVRHSPEETLYSFSLDFYKVGKL